jgi:hypothetical protein
LTRRTKVHIHFLKTNNSSHSIYISTSQEAIMKIRTFIAAGLVVLFSVTVAGADTLTGSSAGVVDVGPVAMPQDAFEQLKGMVAGTFIPLKAQAAPRIDAEDMGLVEMRPQDATALRRMVAGNFVYTDDADAVKRDPEIALGLIDMPEGEYRSLRAMVQQDGIAWNELIADALNGVMPNAGQ